MVDSLVVGLSADSCILNQSEEDNLNNIRKWSTMYYP